MKYVFKASCFHYKMADKVIKICDRCKGSGSLIAGGRQFLCPDCDAIGHTLIDREVYFRQLHWEQKNRKELEK
jgi:predicted RNA-binding Zn-ribbon protein involved in translation (DUF1610 family)